MIVHLELDDEKPRDREILALVFGQVRQPEPPQNAAPDELVQGRDALIELFHHWKETRGFVRLSLVGCAPVVETYVDVCGGLVRAVEAVTSGPAGLGPAESEVIAAQAREFATALVRFADACNFPIPELWRTTA